MRNNILWFVLGLSGGGGTMALAAPGDLIEEINNQAVTITGLQASCFANCAVESGSWTGHYSEVVQTCAFREGNGFRAQTRGIKASSPSNLAARAATGETIHIVGAVK